MNSKIFMARTKQTARKFTGGKAPRQSHASKANARKSTLIDLKKNEKYQLQIWNESDVNDSSCEDSEGELMEPTKTLSAPTYENLQKELTSYLQGFDPERSSEEGNGFTFNIKEIQEVVTQMDKVKEKGGKFSPEYFPIHTAKLIISNDHEGNTSSEELISEILWEYKNDDKWLSFNDILIKDLESKYQSWLANPDEYKGELFADFKTMILLHPRGGSGKSIRRLLEHEYYRLNIWGKGEKVPHILKSGTFEGLGWELEKYLCEDASVDEYGEDGTGWILENPDKNGWLNPKLDKIYHARIFKPEAKVEKINNNTNNNTNKIMPPKKATKPLPPTKPNTYIPMGLRGLQKPGNLKPKTDNKPVITDYNAKKVPELKKLLSDKGIGITQGTGSKGNIVKADMVKALEDYDKNFEVTNSGAVVNKDVMELLKNKIIEKVQSEEKKQLTKVSVIPPKKKLPVLPPKKLPNKNIPEKKSLNHAINEYLYEKKEQTNERFEDDKFEFFDYHDTVMNMKFIPQVRDEHFKKAWELFEKKTDGSDLRESIRDYLIEELGYNLVDSVDKKVQSEKKNTKIDSTRPIILVITRRTMEKIPEEFTIIGDNIDSIKRGLQHYIEEYKYLDDDVDDDDYKEAIDKIEDSRYAPELNSIYTYKLMRNNAIYVK